MSFSWSNCIIAKCLSVVGGLWKNRRRQWRSETSGRPGSTSTKFLDWMPIVFSQFTFFAHPHVETSKWPGHQPLRPIRLHDTAPEGAPVWYPGPGLRSREKDSPPVPCPAFRKRRQKGISVRWSQLNLSLFNITFYYSPRFHLKARTSFKGIFKLTAVIDKQCVRQSRMYRDERRR